jgi:hypothetical protein
MTALEAQQLGRGWINRWCNSLPVMPQSLAPTRQSKSICPIDAMKRVAPIEGDVVCMYRVKVDKATRDNAGIGTAANTLEIGASATYRMD